MFSTLITINTTTCVELETQNENPELERFCKKLGSLGYNTEDLPNEYDGGKIPLFPPSEKEQTWIKRLEWAFSLVLSDPQTEDFECHLEVKSSIYQGSLPQEVSHYYLLHIDPDAPFKELSVLLQTAHSLEKS